MDPNKKPLELAAQIRRDGYHDAADCIERLYQLVIETSIDNLQMREQLMPAACDAVH